MAAPVISFRLKAGPGADWLGYAYLTLTNALAWTAFVSGVLLLLWVTGTGIALTVRRRTLPGQPPGRKPEHPPEPSTPDRAGARPGPAPAPGEW
jgi:hypothetical protein